MFNRFVSEVFTPIPSANIASQRVRKRIDAESRMLFVKAAKQDWPNVTLIHPALPDESDCGIAQLAMRPLVVHSINLCRIQKPLHVFSEAENRRAALGGVTPDALKNA
jgi:hypothetical protein